MTAGVVERWAENGEERSGVRRQPALDRGHVDVVVATKVIPSRSRPGLVCRHHPRELLGTGAGRRLTLVAAPAGWGKTTLVADWVATCRATTVAWLSLDREDDDPVRFWSYVVAAIRRSWPAVGARALELLRAPRLPAAAAALPELLNELLAREAPLLLVIDDYHLITDSQVHAGMVFFIEHLPANVHVVLVTRSCPPLPLGRWRVRGQLVELGTDDLRFDVQEAGALLNEVLGLGLSATSVSRLHEKTEGWVAGLYLAALSLRGQRDREHFVAEFSGDDRHVVDYLRGEVLDALPDPTRELLVATSILDRLTGPLCDVVAETTGSGVALAEVERSTHFVMPLDSRGAWYRHHQLFRELLKTELESTSPMLVAARHRRAASWLLDHGLVAEAIHHTTLAGDTTRAADLIAERWVGFLQRGELATVTRALDELGEEVVLADPRLCLVRAWMTINLGQLGWLGRWIDAARRASRHWPHSNALGLSAAAAMLACIEKYLTGDVGEAVAAARAALALDAVEVPPWRSVGCPVLGIALHWAGRADDSLNTLTPALVRAEEAGNFLAAVHARGCLALAAAERHDYSAALELAHRALAISGERGLTQHWAGAMALLAMGKALMAEGALDEAETAVATAVELSRRGLARVELAYGLLALAELRRRDDASTAARLVGEAEQVVACCPDPGIVGALVASAARRARTRGARPPRVLFSGEELSDRERAVLGLLPTELTLREVAASLFVSINTVKTQTRAIYRKLGVTSRAEAVARARQLGLA